MKKTIQTKEDIISETIDGLTIERCFKLIRIRHEDEFREAIRKSINAKIEDLKRIQESSGSKDQYGQGMYNGMEVVRATLLGNVATRFMNHKYVVDKGNVSEKLYLDGKEVIIKMKKDFNRFYKRIVSGYGSVMAENEEEADKMFNGRDFKDFPKSDKIEWEKFRKDRKLTEEEGFRIWEIDEKTKFQKK